MFATGDEDELEIAVAQPDFGLLDPKEGNFTVHRSLLDELPVKMAQHAKHSKTTDPE